jgi:KRAB domain-containing zinc finger protein
MPAEKYKKTEDGKNFICPHCGQLEENQSTMYYHMNKHLGINPYECEHCGEKFPQKQRLKMHILNHHTQNPVKQFECPFDGCSQAFLQKAHLRVHVSRNHIRETILKWMTRSEKKYVCGCCDKSCNSESAFIYHAFDHAKAEPNLQNVLRNL